MKVAKDFPLGHYTHGHVAAHKAGGYMHAADPTGDKPYFGPPRTIPRLAFGKQVGQSTVATGQAGIHGLPGPAGRTLSGRRPRTVVPSRAGSL